MTVPSWKALGNAIADPSDIDVDYPAGWSAGDLLFLVCETANQSASTPSGWTLLANIPQGTGTAGGTSATALYVWYRFAESGDSGVASLSDSGNHQIARMFSVSDADGTTPVLITAGSVLSSAGLTGTATGFTTTAADCLIVFVGTNATDSASLSCTVANATVTSLTARFTSSDTSGNGGGISVATGVMASAGAIGSSTFTWGSSAVQAMLVFAVQPTVPVVTEQYALSSGDWSSPGTWSTGVVPTTGTVYSNGYNVTVDVSSAATVVTNVAGTVASAGGSFVLANGVTLTANVYAGAATCVTLATGVTAGVTGDSYGGSLSNTYGVSKTGTGTFTLAGNCYGGSGSHGVINLGAGTVEISGNCYGSDTSSSAYGARNASSGTLTVGGDVIAGAAAPGLSIVSTGTTSVAGSVYAVGSVVGMLHGGSTNNVTIEGDVIGGTTVLAYGLQCTSSGNATVLGSAISPASPGVGPGIGVTGTGTATIGYAVTGTGCGSPCVGHIHVADLSTTTVSVRSVADTVTLSDEVDLPSPFQPASVFGAV